MTDGLLECFHQRHTGALPGRDSKRASPLRWPSFNLQTFGSGDNTSIVIALESHHNIMHERVFHYSVGYSPCRQRDGSPTLHNLPVACRGLVGGTRQEEYLGN